MPGTFAAALGSSLCVSATPAVRCEDAEAYAQLLSNALNPSIGHSEATVRSIPCAALAYAVSAPYPTGAWPTGMAL